MVKLPWLEYAGQTTSELIAGKNTHRIAPLLCGFEWGIQAKAGPGGEEDLAIMALQGEANNSGYSQFFVNSSRRFAPIHCRVAAADRMCHHRSNHRRSNQRTCSD
jgi:hypothetical protein